MSDYDILTTLNRELMQAIRPVVDYADGSEVYSAFVEVVRGPTTLPVLQSLNGAQISQLADAFNDFFECSGIESGQIQKAIDATIWHHDGAH